MARSLRRYVSVIWDRSAARQMQAEADAAFEKVAASGSAEFEAGMKEGGRKAARTLSRALQQEYRLRMAQAREQLADGTIDEKAFEREGRDAAVAFNRGLTGGLRRLRGQGNVDALTMAGLTGQFKREPGVGRAGIFGGMALRGFAGPLAGVLTAGAALNESREMISAADEMERSVRRLEGTSKLAGVSLDDLRKSAEAAKEEFKLGTPAANDLTGIMTRLAARAGDLTQTQGALRGWLDLAAAGGLTAAEAMEALEVTFRGQDEGLNRLGLANPQQIYEKWAGSIGTTASKMTDAQKAQAILNEVVFESQKVQGAWADSMELASGQADQQRQKIRDLQAEAGEAIRPLQALALEFKVGLYEALVAVANKLTEILDRMRELRNERWDRLPGWLKARRGGSEGMSAEDLAALDAAIAGPPASTGGPSPTPTTTTPELTEAQKKAAAARRERLRLAWARIGTPESMHLTGVRSAEGMRGDHAAAINALGGTLEHVPGGMGDIQRRALEDATREMEEHYQRVQAVAQEAAYQISSAFQDAFQLMREEGATLGNFLEGIARGIGGAMLAGLAQFAQGKVSENVAAAIEAAAYALGFTSHGNFASASAAWASAAEHSAAALAWGALAGGAGAGRGMVTGGAGGIPPSTRDAGLDIAQRSTPEPSPITIVVDPFDPGNPVHAKGVGEGMNLSVRLGGVPTWASRR